MDLIVFSQTIFSFFFDVCRCFWVIEDCNKKRFLLVTQLRMAQNTRWCRNERAGNFELWQENFKPFSSSSLEFSIYGFFGECRENSSASQTSWATCCCAFRMNEVFLLRDFLIFSSFARATKESIVTADFCFHFCFERRVNSKNVGDVKRISLGNYLGWIKISIVWSAWLTSVVFQCSVCISLYSKLQTNGLVNAAQIPSTSFFSVASAEYIILSLQMLG